MIEATFVVRTARICHQVNKAICETLLGDFSQSDWDNAAEWQRKSAIDGVIFAILNPDATPEDQHNAWMQAKLEAGWIFGPEKNEVKKTHPCLVPYSELPKEQRVKDATFQAIVKETT